MVMHRLKEALPPSGVQVHPVPGYEQGELGYEVGVPREGRRLRGGAARGRCHAVNA
jgi:hypothetical protein